MAHAAAAQEKTLELPVLTRAASFMPKTVNADARTVDLIWTVGARVMRGFFERYYEELSLDPKHVRMKRINNGAPLLSNHDRDSLDSVIGVIESARIENGKGVGTVRFAKAEDNPEAERVFRLVQDGILQNISVGYQTFALEEVGKAKDGIPVFRATDWEPAEFSVVPIGADDAAGFRAAEGDKRTPCVFTTRAAITKDKTMDGDEETPVTAAPQESPAVVMTRDAHKAGREERERLVAAEKAAAEEATKAERTRCAELRRLGKRHRQSDEWVNKMIENNVSRADAERALLEILAGEDDEIGIDGLRITAGDDRRDKFIKGASAWLFERSGSRPLLEDAKRKYPELFKGVEFDGGEFRGMSPMDLARESLERHGVKTRGRDRMEIVGMAFTHRAPGYQVASDFPTLLENVLSKVLLGAYAMQANTWQRITKSEEVPDFRTSNRYRTGSLPGLDVIAEHAEYKTGNIPDGAKYPIATQRMGKMFGLTREAIINDDMSALTDMAGKLGQAAQRSIENMVYALINANSGLGPTQSDSQPFFHSNRSNVNGTGSALAVAGLDADRVIMGQQKDPNALDYLDLQPAVLLVPLSLYGTAQQLNDAQFDPTVNKFQVPNMVRGLFKEVVASPRITGTRRYLIAEPRDWIVVAFLEGYGRGPVLESQDGWRIDGVEWKVTLYAKAQMGDPKDAVTNAGV